SLDAPGVECGVRSGGVPATGASRLPGGCWSTRVTATADGELVLIVEDNDKSRKLFRELLQLHGFRTLDAKAGAEGIALALEHRPLVVVIDIQLADTDGVASLRLLRTAPEPYEGPVVAVTAYAMTSDA